MTRRSSTSLVHHSNLSSALVFYPFYFCFPSLLLHWPLLTFLLFSSQAVSQIPTFSLQPVDWVAVSQGYTSAHCSVGNGAQSKKQDMVCHVRFQQGRLGTQRACENLRIQSFSSAEFILDTITWKDIYTIPVPVLSLSKTEQNKTWKSKQNVGKWEKSVRSVVGIKEYDQNILHRKTF